MREYLTLRQIQLEELAILVAFREFCDAYGLTYSLCGGTMLGAVRHGGFIPWDDDVDVFMPRPDYDRLLSLADRFQDITGLPIEPFTPDARYAPYVKVVNPSIAAQPANERKQGHLWIDVFPADGYPDTLQEAERICRQAHHWRAYILAAYSTPASGSSALRRAVKGVFGPVGLAFRVDKWAAKKLHGLSTAIPYDGAARVGIVNWSVYGPEGMPAHEAFEDLVRISFEGEQFDAVGCWDEYLRLQFDDYLTLPPEDERQAHGLRAWREG